MSYDDDNYRAIGLDPEGAIEPCDLIRQLETDRPLTVRLTRMLAHMARHNWYDKADLMRLLRDCRAHLEREAEAEKQRQEWWHSQDQDDEWIAEHDDQPL